MQNDYHAYKLVAGTVSPFVSHESLLDLLVKHKRLDWESVAKIAGNHSIVQALYPALVGKNLIDQIPNEFISYLQELNQLNCKRNSLMQSQLMDAVSVINDLDIKPILMKGAAHFFLDTFSDKGERLLTDLDVLVPNDKITLVSNSLIKSGYKYIEDKMAFIETHHHYPPLIKNGECAMIELHRDLMFHEQQHVFPTNLAWDKSVDITLPNQSKAKVLIPTYRVFHSFLHSAVVDRLHQKGYIEIRQLHELARTQLMYGSDIDWEEMLALAHEYDIDRQLCANLYSAVKFMNFPNLAEMVNTYIMSSKFHHYRVCSKLKYGWFNLLDNKLQRRIRRFKSIFSEPIFAHAGRQ